MKTLFQQETFDEVCQRLKNLPSNAQRQWGKMTLSQMLAHCVATFETACGLRHPQRTLIGKLLGWAFKHTYLNDNPLGKNSPTHPTFVMTGDKDFEAEKAKLIAVIKQFYEGGEAKCTKHPHSFFGHLTPNEWARSQYKHLDHHLKQFNV